MCERQHNNAGDTEKQSSARGFKKTPSLRDFIPEAKEPPERASRDEIVNLIPHSTHKIVTFDIRSMNKKSNEAT